MNSSAMGISVFGFILGIIIVLICREIVCWYWKINESLQKQDETNESLKEIVRQLKVLNTKPNS